MCGKEENVNKKAIGIGILAAAAAAGIGALVMKVWRDLQDDTLVFADGDFGIIPDPDEDGIADPEANSKNQGSWSPDDIPNDENSPAASAYLSGYGDGYNEGFLAGQNSMKIQPQEPDEEPPTADDDSFPECFDAETDGLADPPDHPAEEKEWPCISKLRSTRINKGKQVAGLIMTCIPFGHEAESNDADLVDAVLQSTFNTIKHQAKSADRKPNTFAAAFEMIRDFRDGKANIGDLLAMASKPERIEPVVQRFLEADPEDQKQALENICNVLSVINPDRIIEIANETNKKPE